MTETDATRWREKVREIRNIIEQLRGELLDKHPPDCEKWNNRLAVIDAGFVPILAWLQTLQKGEHPDLSEGTNPPDPVHEELINAFARRFEGVDREQIVKFFDAYVSGDLLDFVPDENGVLQAVLKERDQRHKFRVVVEYSPSDSES